MESKETEREASFTDKFKILTMVAIAIVTVIWMFLANDVNAAGLDSTCFVFEKSGTEMIIYACDEGKYRVIVKSGEDVVSGGLLTSETPCPILYVGKDYIVYIKDEKTGKIVSESVY